MNKKLLTLLLAGGCVILIGGAVLLYSLLSARAVPGNPLESGSSDGLATEQSSQSLSSTQSSAIVSSDTSSQSGSDESQSSAASDASQSSSLSSSSSAASSHSSSQASASSSKPATSSSVSSSNPTLPVSFTVYTESGGAVSLASRAGKPIVINFWATWCPYCVQEMADFQSVYNEYGSRVNFMMIDLADGQRETVESGAAYIREKGYSFPVYYDTAYSASTALSVRYMPTTVIINAGGSIIYNNAGALSASTLRQLLDTALS